LLVECLSRVVEAVVEALALVGFSKIDRRVAEVRVVAECTLLSELLLPVECLSRVEEALALVGFSMVGRRVAEVPVEEAEEGSLTNSNSNSKKAGPQEK
jgi:hypothetical protein